jgi:DNA-binding beta-propeller fold protein YncE
MRTELALCALLVAAACGGDDDGDGVDAGVDAAVQCVAEPGVICTIAGNGEADYAGDGEPALAASFSLPQDTLKGQGDTLYILDWNNHRVRKLTPAGTVEHVAGRGELGGGLDEPANSDFNHLTNIILDPSGERLIIAAWHNSKIREVDLATGEITDTCGDGRRAYFGDGGPAATAALDLPAAIVHDPDGNLVIMDQANQVIRLIDGEGNIHRLAGQCIVDTPPPAGPGPCAVPVPCPGGSGKLTCGDPEATCGSACNPIYAAGTADTMRMAQPFGQSADPAGRMVFDADGNLLFADTDNSIIRKLDMVSREVSIVAGLEPVDGVAQKGYSGDGGPATEAKLNRPVDLALDEDGTLYVSDVFNHCIRAITPDGTIDTVVGRCGERGRDGDGGPATEALLKLPYGVEVADGVLYVADTGNYVIRAVPLH